MLPPELQPVITEGGLVIDFFDLRPELARIISSGSTVLVIAIVAWLLSRISRRAITSAVEGRMERIKDMEQEDRDERAATVAGTLSRAVSLTIWVLAAVTAMAEFGVSVIPVITGLGIGALVLAFAGQNIIRDYLHGFLIVTEDWYRVGEVACLAGATGMVTEMSLRTTVLRDSDGAVHQIPNGQITTATNMTREFARINFNIEVGYGEDLDRVVAVIDNECEKMKAEDEWAEQLLTTPSAVRVDKLGASGVEIRIMGDTKPMSRVGAVGELKKRLKKRFDTEGIEIPWPHTKVIFGNSPSGDGASSAA